MRISHLVHAQVSPLSSLINSTNAFHIDSFYRRIVKITQFQYFAHCDLNNKSSTIVRDVKYRTRAPFTRSSLERVGICTRTIVALLLTWRWEGLAIGSSPWWFDRGIDFWRGMVEWETEFERRGRRVSNCKSFVRWR